MISNAKVNTANLRGKVKWFNNDKGYGFIRRDDLLEDIFVHYTAIINKGFKTLDEGQDVQFELIKGEKGLQATNVVKIEKKHVF